MFDLCSHARHRRTPPDVRLPPKPLSPAAADNPSSEARAARLAKFKREQLIVDYLNRGVSVAEIAAQIGVGEKRMRAVIREILARRMPHPPEEFVAIQVSRLNEALLVAFSAMSPTNLKAVDQVVKIVRELDRYGGAFAAEWRRPEASRLEAPVERGVRRRVDLRRESAAAEFSLAPLQRGEGCGVRGLGDWPRDARPAPHPNLLPEG